MRRRGTNGQPDLEQVYEYDSQGRMCRYHTPETDDTYYSYNAAGELVAYSRGLGAAPAPAPPPHPRRRLRRPHRRLRRSPNRSPSPSRNPTLYPSQSCQLYLLGPAADPTFRNLVSTTTPRPPPPSPASPPAI